MRVAIIGSGGREHALAWKLGQCVNPADLYVIPGNGGTENNVDLDPMDFHALEAFCQQRAIDLLVVGPEAPLDAGLADHFASGSVRVFGPGRDGARLESSKIWAKQFMARHDVATGGFRACQGVAQARQAALEMGGDLVLKYDGLAAGKGVFVCQSMDEAEQALERISSRYGDDAPCLAEERLEGAEVSVIGFTDGEHIRLLQPSQDHKQLLDGDRGPNTGGMGAFCPVPWFDNAMAGQVLNRVVQPTLDGLRQEGIAYRGVIYFGLMITSHGPRLLEYNVRLGDPEAEVVLPALKSDLLALCLACCDGTLEKQQLAFHGGYFADVVLASGGYPGAYPKGLPITGLDELDPQLLVFHAGTRRSGDELLTAGGRVLNVVGQGPDLDSALRRAYRACAAIQFEGKFHRSDIGRRPWRA